MLRKVINKRFIKVKVFAGAKKEQVIRKADDSFIIHTKEPAENSRANKRIKEILPLYLSIKPKSIKLIKGAKQSSKIYEVYC